MTKKLALVVFLALSAVFAVSVCRPPAVRCEEQKKESLSEKDRRALLKQAGIFMRQKKYAEALQLLLRVLSYRPDDGGTWYNAACCAARLKDAKSALLYLQRAFENGYVDFAWAQKDPDLEYIRNTAKFKALLRKKKKYYKAANELRMKRVSEYYGQMYKVKVYPDERIIFVSDVEESKYKRLLDIIHRVNLNHFKRLFRHKPEVYNIVLCPSSKEEYNKHFPPMNVLGVFMPATKTLFVDLNVGEGTLVHEYTHALHFADQDALGQRHPIWIVEGFATLFENSSFFGSTQLRPRHGFRLMVLAKIIGTPSYVPLKTLMKMDHRRFMARAGACYAESRLVMYWLYRKGLLRKFYYHYTRNYRTDPTGIFSLEQVTGKPLDEFEKSWQSFVLREARGVFDQKVKLGVKLTMAALNCLVFEVEEGSPADKAGIKPGDVLYSYNGKRLRSSADLTEVLSRERPGDKAKIVLLRDGEKVEVVVQYPKEERKPGTGYLGIASKPVEGGILVARVVKDSPADKAGIKPGDVLVEGDGQRLETAADFKALMATKCPGDRVKFVVKRGERTKRIKVKLGARPKVRPGINPGV